jgi:hypothetical protein
MWCRNGRAGSASARNTGSDCARSLGQAGDVHGFLAPAIAASFTAGTVWHRPDRAAAGRSGMGWRFRRTVRILPGVRLNLSKSGVSTSIGVRGATINLGKRGAKATIGLPGTGISYSTPIGAGAATGGDAAPGSSARRWPRRVLLVVIVVAAAIAGALSSRRAPDPQAEPTPDACPCSGAANCTGPRGGHYCITAAGRKQYRPA